MSGKDIAIDNECDTQISGERDKYSFKNLLIVLSCLLCSILTTYLLHNPYGSYIPIMLIAIFEWYRSFPRQTRSYYGLCRLLLYILVISSWVVFILKLIIESIALLLGYHHIPIKNVEHLFPYALIFTTFARGNHDMDLHDKRRYIIHVLYDIPAFLLVIIFKLLNNPLNALYSQITTHCYIGSLPTVADVEKLNKIEIKYVVNMCAEYNGPRKTYEKYNMKQLHLPTVDCTAPSLKSIEKAIKFMNEAYTNKQNIFVHCKAGMGRSATVVLCHMVANEKMTPENALKLLKEKRPEITNTIIDYTPVKQFLASLKKQ
jgi:atypical dual specificity phosphatase